MEEKEAKNYIKAGKILSEVKENAQKGIKLGQKLLDIASKIEAEIVDIGGKPAFPVNLSLNNNAAHYTPSIEDLTAISENDVLKVDIGAHVDGYIADCAFTLDFTGKYGKLVEAAEKALENAVAMAKPGIELRAIGAAIEKTINGYGFKPISNLSGHGLEQFTQHAEPSIPNTATNDARKLEDECAFAIEPFATTGSGIVREAVQTEIFALEEERPVRNQHARRLLEFIAGEYETLPFAERWIANSKKLKFGEFERKVALRELMQSGAIRAFPILHDEKNSFVAQAETSLLLHEGKIINLVSMDHK